MRALLVLLGLAVVAVALLMAFGMIDIDQTKSAQLPQVTIEGGQAPRFQADVGRVDVGTENRTVAVPPITDSQADNTVAPPPAPQARGTAAATPPTRSPLHSAACGKRVSLHI